MEVNLILSVAALVLSLAAGAVGIRVWLQVRALRLGLGPRAGPLAERLEAVGRRLAAVERGQAGLEEALGQAGLRPAVVHYAPVGLSGARNCFVLALLNREGNGVVLNYLTGTAFRADLKEVRRWQSAGLAFTAEEEQAVAQTRSAWGVAG